MPGFDPLDYPDGLERDIYDYEHRSVHCLLRHRPTGTNAGTVRLVLADPVRPDAPFPIEVAAGEHIDRDYLGKFCAARGTIAECSRFIVARRFRSRRGEQQWPDGLAEEGLDADRGSDERRVLTHPVLGLIKAAMIMSWERQVQLLVHGDGAAAESATASVWTRAPACEPADRLSWAGPRPLGLPSGSLRE